MKKILAYLFILVSVTASAQYYPPVGGSFASTNDLYGRRGSDYVYTQVNGVRGGLFWWNPTITAASDSGTIFRVPSISTGAWQRIVNNSVGLNPYMFGAVGDSVTNDNFAVNQAVIKSAELRVPMRFPAGSFTVNGRCPVAGRDLFIIWEGGRVIMAGNSVWLDYEAGYFSHDNVESTAVVDTIIDANAIAPTRTFRLTLPSLNPGIHYGSYVKITSIDQLPYTDNSQVGSGTFARMGDPAIVIGIVVSGGKTKVYLNSVPEYSEKYATQIKLHGINSSKLTMEGRGSIEAIDGGDTLGFANPFIRVKNAFNVDLSGVNFLRQYQPAIHLYSVYFSRIRMMNFGVGKTAAGERVSYGIRDNACAHNDYSIFESSKIRHTYTNTVSLLSTSQLDSISNYGASAYSTIHGINGWGNDNSSADLHDGCHHMKVFDVYSEGGMTGGGSNGNGFGFRGRFNEFNNITVLPSRRGGTFFSQFGDSSCAFNTIRNSSFKGWQYAFSVNSGYKAVGIVFDNCEFDVDTTSGDLFDLKNCEITFLRCKLKGSGTNGMRIFKTNENVQLTLLDNDIYWPSNLGASRLAWQRGDSLLIYGENNRFHLASALDLLVYSDTAITYHGYGGIYLYNTITNKNVSTIKSTLIDTAFPVRLSLEKRLLNSIPSTSGDFVITPSSGQQLRFPYYTDKVITVRTLNNANDSISIIDSGNCESQLIRIYNTAGAFNLSLLKNNLTKLTGDTTKIIRPNEFISLIWDKTSSLWREVKNRPQPVVQTANTDANVIVSSATDVLVLKASVTATRSVSTRNPFECRGTELIVIDSTLGGFQYNWTPLVYDPRVNSTVQKIPILSTTVLRSDGIRWVIQSQVADTLHVNKIRADTLTAGLTRTTYTPRMKYPIFDTAATSQRVYYMDAPFGRTDSLSKVNDSTLRFYQRSPLGVTTTYDLNMQGGHNGGGSPGIGTNLFTADQTQTANRQHNSADFTFLIDSSKSYTLRSRSQTGTVGDISQFSMLPNSIESRSTNGSTFSASSTTIASTILQSQSASKFGSITVNGGSGLSLIHQAIGNIRFPSTNMVDSLVQLGWGTNDITDTTFRVTVGRQYSDAAAETGVKVYLNGQRRTGALQDSTFFLMREGASFRARYVSIQDIAAKINATISGMAIGGAIGNSPVTGRSLFVGSDGSLQQTSKFQYDSTNGKVSINGAGTTAISNVRGITAQQQLEYDGSNFFATTVASNGSTTFTLTGTSSLFTFSNGINMNSTVTNGNLWIPNAQATTTSGSSKVAFGGVANTHVRFAPGLGSTSSTLTANYNYAGVDNGDQAITEGTSGTHRILANTRIGGIVGTAGGSLTKFMVGLYISNPSATGNGITPDSASYPLWTEGAPRFDIAGATTGAIYYQGTNGGLSTLNPGTNGQVLTLSGGLPVWQTGGGGGGSGTVNSGLINQLAYYSGSGTAVSGLPIPTPNRAWVGDANGLPIASATTATQIGYLSNVSSDLQNQINGKADALVAPTTVSGTTYSLTSADNNRTLRFTSNSPITLTAPTGLPAGFYCTIWQIGTGNVTFAAGGGATVSNGDGNTKTAGPNLPAFIQYSAANTYLTGGRMQP